MNKFYGEWKIDKKKSESIEPLLKFFGVPYFVRKLIGDDNTIIIKNLGKGEFSVKDVVGKNETEEVHKFEKKFLKSIDKRGNPVKRKAVFKDGVVTLMTLSNNSNMIIRQLDLQEANVLRDRIYYKKYGDNQFKSITRMYNRDKSRSKNAKGGGRSKNCKKKKEKV